MPPSSGRRSSTCPPGSSGERPCSTCGRRPASWPSSRACWPGSPSSPCASPPSGFSRCSPCPTGRAVSRGRFRVALPAVGVALVLAALRPRRPRGLHAARARSSSSLPAAGILLGVWAGLAWRRGWWSRLFFLPKLAAVGVAASSSAASSSRAGARAGAGGRRGGSDRLRRQAPPRGPLPRPGSRARCRRGRPAPSASPREELDQLVAWAASVGLKARTTVEPARGRCVGRGHGPGPADRTVAQRDAPRPSPASRRAGSPSPSRACGWGA